MPIWMSHESLLDLTRSALTTYIARSQVDLSAVKTFLLDKRHGISNGNFLKLRCYSISNLLGMFIVLINDIFHVQFALKYIIRW